MQKKIAHWVHTARYPPKYLVASLIVSFGGMLNGLDTGTIGPVTTMPAFAETFGELSSALHGFVVSSILIAATLASLFAGSLSNTLGRTHTIALGAFLFAVGATIAASASSLVVFVAARCIVGFGEGAFLSTLVVYVCEISPPRKRGVLASTVQLFTTLGIMMGYFTCYGTNNIQSSFAWRLPFIIQAGIAASLAVVAYAYLPQSPRWLAYKDRKEEASAAWDRLGVSDAEREKYSLESPVLGDTADASVPVAQGNILDKWKDGVQAAVKMFGKDTRRQMFLAVFMMSMQQLSGIDGVLYYAPMLFQQAGISSVQATFFASGVSAILIFVSTIPAFLLADKWGRRASTIYGGFVLSGCMLLIGSLYASDSVHATYGAGRWVVIVAIYIFALGYSTTWAVGVKLYASEIQPISTRATATALSQSANCITNFLVALFTPILLAKSSFGAYFLFGGASIFTVGVCALFMPETRGQSLESIGEMFRLHRVEDMRVVRLMKKFAVKVGLVSANGLSNCGTERSPVEAALEYGNRQSQAGVLTAIVENEERGEEIELIALKSGFKV